MGGPAGSSELLRLVAAGMTAVSLDPGLMAWLPLRRGAAGMNVGVRCRSARGGHSCRGQPRLRCAAPLPTPLLTPRDVLSGDWPPWRGVPCPAFAPCVPPGRPTADGWWPLPAARSSEIKVATGFPATPRLAANVVVRPCACGAVTRCAASPAVAVSAPATITTSATFAASAPAAVTAAPVTAPVAPAPAAPAPVAPAAARLLPAIPPPAAPQPAAAPAPAAPAAPAPSAANGDASSPAGSGIWGSSTARPTVTTPQPLTVSPQSGQV